MALAIEASEHRKRAESATCSGSEESSCREGFNDEAIRISNSDIKSNTMKSHTSLKTLQSGANLQRCP